MGNQRHRLSSDEVEVLKSYRAIREHSKAMGLDPKTVKDGWIKTPDASLRFINPHFGDGVTLDAMIKEFAEQAKEHAPSYDYIEREPLKEPHLFTLNLADLHIGKLSTKAGTGEEYNVDLAITTVKETVAKLVDNIPREQVEKIVITTGNDILHTDGSKPMTTRGTLQDVSGTWHENFVLARKLYVEIIEQLLGVADVHVVHLPSNHDYASGFFLTEAVRCWFGNNKNVTFDSDMRHRKYYEFGRNLLGYTHGDGTKAHDLPLLMANEAKEGWAKTDFRYIYVAHFHHKEQVKFMSGKDYHGATVEFMRSPSPADSWHHVSGYQHTKRAIEGFLHHHKYGQITRTTSPVLR